MATDTGRILRRAQISPRPAIWATRPSPLTPSAPISTPSPPKAIPIPGSSSATTVCMVVDAQATPATARQVIERVRADHRQADQVRPADPLSRRARARCFRLCRRGNPGIGRHADPDRRARQGRHGFRDRPVSAAVPRRREHPRADLAVDHLPRPDVSLARPPRGAHHAYRPRHTPPATSSPMCRTPMSCSRAILVEYHSACYCGDAHFTDWPATLDRLAEFSADALVPGRGAALKTAKQVADGIALTEDFLTTLYSSVSDSAGKGRSLREALRRRSAASWIRNSQASPFTNTACRSMSRAPMTKRRHRASGDLDGGARPRHVGGVARVKYGSSSRGANGSGPKWLAR